MTEQSELQRILAAAASEQHGPLRHQPDPVLLYAGGPNDGKYHRWKGTAPPAQLDLLDAGAYHLAEISNLFHHHPMPDGAVCCVVQVGFLFTWRPSS
jgi:hypothetical protein